MIQNACAVLGVGLAAVAVRLAVRIVNRPNRRAIWTAVGLIALLAYPVSFGPAVWIADRGWISLDSVVDCYYPIVRLEGWPGETMRDYGAFGVRRGSSTPLKLLIIGTTIVSDRWSDRNTVPFTYEPEPPDDATDS